MRTGRGKILLPMLTKRFLAIFMALLLVSTTIFAAGPDFNLRRGTVLSVRIVSSITSKNGGVDPSAIVENDVYGKNGELVIRRGTPVVLQVDKKKAKGCGKPGYVNVKCVSTSAVDGQSITLEGAVSDEGDSKKGLALGLGFGLGLTFLPFVGFAFLAIRGEQGSIADNTVMPSVFVMNDYTVKTTE